MGPDQVPLGKNFHSRPGCRQKSLLRSSGVGGGGQNLIHSILPEKKSPPWNQTPNSLKKTQKIPPFLNSTLCRGPGEASKCWEANIVARQFLQLYCRAFTLNTGAVGKEAKKPSLVEAKQSGRHSKTICLRVIASQQLPRDSGESILFEASRF